MARLEIASKKIEPAEPTRKNTFLHHEAERNELWKVYAEEWLFRNERAVLSRLRHPHILAWERETTARHDGRELPALVFPWRGPLVTLRQWTEKAIGQVKGERELKRLTHELAARLLDLARTLDYLHRNQIAHLSLNPDCVLVAADGIRLTQFALATDWNVRALDNQLALDPAFTHPELAAAATREQQATLLQKLQAAADIFSLGRTILALLGTIDAHLPDITVYDYAFSYLHLAACRMLQGYNQEPDKSSFFKESWLNLHGNDFRALAYQSTAAICYDLEKLLGKANLKSEVPECDTAHFRGILVQKDAMIPLTERVQAMINHPVFSRLKNVEQLDLLENIYPTCRHTRYEHSLGAFYQAIQMVNHLYEDEYNPLFRQLVDAADIRKVLLYALLHDIAQYPFAHTIEECLPEAYHENFTESVLRSSAQDAQGRTLKDIIENPETGWDIGFEDFVGFATKSSLFAAHSIKEQLLKSLVDGPLDADKLDYLVRDSRECGLVYGECIDHQRLYRNLTVTMERQKSAVLLHLAVYDKGATAADSLSFARYMLYRSVYWHHTSRAIRAMVNTLVQQIVLQEKKGKRQLFARKLKKFLGFDGHPKNTSSHDMLAFLGSEAPQPAQELATMLQSRQYYKLLYDFDMDRETTDQDELLQKFRQHAGKQDFNAQLQQRILALYLTAVQSGRTGMAARSLLAGEHAETTLNILQTKLAILTDAPPPSLGARHKLRVVPVPKSIRKNYRYRSDSYSRTTGVWEKIHAHLMDLAAAARVYCHPEIRESLLAALGPSGIREAIAAVLG
ncbi:MAG: HD domain-containing protein [Leptospiraceae bacterium]|nr:HD domain-containing protein [Leptospiraceae bacterium]